MARFAVGTSLSVASQETSLLHTFFSSKSTDQFSSPAKNRLSFVSSEENTL
jgi:hypothetical protein